MRRENIPGIELKKKYTISLTPSAQEKAQRVLRKAGISLSSFLDVMLCQFVEIINDTEMETKMENMTMSQCLGMLSEIVGKIEEINDDELSKKLDSMKVKGGRPRKNVKEKES